ncbi:MAG: ribose-phosphate diphosphokinase [Dokdonella sp.]
MNPIVFAFPGVASLSDRLREDVGATSGILHWRHFPDGESLIALEGDCQDRDVILACTLCDPDRLALPLLFAARAAREFGARSVGLVAPYLAYMRQDARFHAGEAISSLHFAAFLSWAVDWLVTVDPHLHRHADLQTLFTIPARSISAMPSIAGWIRANVANPVLIGPDGESAQWVEPLAQRVSAPVVILEKRRRGDRDVSVSAIDRSVVEGRTPVLVDDIISSGHTMAETLGHLRALGSLPAVCIAVHGLFADETAAMLQAAGAARVVTTNTIDGPGAAIDVADLLTPLVRERLHSIRSSMA